MVGGEMLIQIRVKRVKAGEQMRQLTAVLGYLRHKFKAPWTPKFDESRQYRIFTFDIRVESLKEFREYCRECNLQMRILE